MKRRPILVLLAAALAVPPLAFAGTPATQISVLDSLQFDPKTPAPKQVTTGSQFHWTHTATVSGPQHDVSSINGLFRSGDVTRGTIDFTVTASAGTFVYRCELHGSPDGTSGMVGTISVRPGALNLNATNHTFQVEWASAGTNTGSLFDVRYRPKGQKKWAKWKNDSPMFVATFGGSGRPITPTPGQVYQFQARSELGSDTSQHSDWSPTLSVTTP